MRGVWVTVIAVGVASIALKALGPVVLGGHELPAPVQRLVALLAPTLLTALIATQIFGGERRLVLDSRAVGLAAAAAALLLRMPALLVVVIAAGATALARAAF